MKPTAAASIDSLAAAGAPINGRSLEKPPNHLTASNENYSSLITLAPHSNEGYVFRALNFRKQAVCCEEEKVKRNLRTGISRLTCLVMLCQLALAACAGGAPAANHESLPTSSVEPTALLSPTPTRLPDPTATPAATAGMVRVDSGQVEGEISPLLFGTNYGPWSVVPVDLQDEAQAGGFMYLRFPGGNWGDDNDLKHYHIDQYINLARALGAEPAISARMHGGSVEKAAELVRYTNVEKGYGVRYWSVGNEPELYGDVDTLRYNQEWRAMAEAMRAVDPSIVLVGPDITQYRGDPALDPRDAQGRLWMDEFLKANGDLVDVVSIHRYPFPTTLGAEVVEKADLYASAEEWDSIIPALRAQIRAQTGRDLPVAVTEFNSHWNKATGGETTPDSAANAVWLAGVITRMARQGVTIGAQFALQSAPKTGGWGLLSGSDVRPAYHLYPLFQQMGSQRVLSTSGVEQVSVLAALRGDGRLSVLLVHSGLEAKEVPLRLDGGWNVDPVELLRPGEPAQEIALEDTLELPAESVTLLILEKR
ncbi:hypothetical protein ADN00_03870 [Ornatilinea apprima]|uniref:Alpha-L-arabinofuranosidase C-terminal domain-containing protein n=1 Tax=Ornatilinea apprima TaxID=1134406 RepID=A0A0P6XQI1_9CHLR|nr:hypothetical protein [Ornatilinea apprima]KPL79037.1 hypothetical protein ADN00_03870 [Ornatilinea apprima]